MIVLILGLRKIGCMEIFSVLTGLGCGVRIIDIFIGLERSFLERVVLKKFRDLGLFVVGVVLEICLIFA